MELQPTTSSSASSVLPKTGKASNIERAPGPLLHGTGTTESQVSPPARAPERSPGTVRAIQERQSGKMNLRIDKREVPDASAKETTKILTEEGAIFELLGTLDEDDSRELLERHGFEAAGQFRFRPGIDGVVRLARQIEESGQRGDFVIVKKFYSHAAARKEFDAIQQLGPAPAFVEALGIACCEDKDGLPRGYVFLRLVAGADLEKDLATLSAGLKDPATRDAADHQVRVRGKGMLSAIAAVHARGRQHGDVKLRNFIKAPEGHVVACDFARSSANAAANPFRTDSFGAAVCLLCFAEGKQMDHPTIRLRDKEGQPVETTPVQLFNERHRFDIESMAGETVDEVAAKLIVGMTPKAAMQLPYYAGI